MTQSAKQFHPFMAYLEFWPKAFVFNATATRSQYWIPWITNRLIFFGYCLVTQQWQHYTKYGSVNLGLAPPDSIPRAIIVLIAMGICLVVIIGQFTLRARRLHDLNLSNWFILLFLVPVVGNIIMFVLMLMPTKANPRWWINQSNY